MTIHWGQTIHPGSLRLHRGTIGAKGCIDQECYFEHPIKCWYGISIGNTFFGVIRTGGTNDVREPATLTRKAS